MGFSGGGSNQTQPHTHDSNVINDGGSLNANGVTQMGMSAGDITYSDGNNLQILTYPAAPAGETLTAVAASTAPSWGVAGGSTYSFIEEFILGGSTPSWTVTLTTPFVLANYENLVCEAYIKHDTNSEKLRFRFNGLTADYTGMYFYTRAGSAPATRYDNNTTYIEVNTDMGNSADGSTGQCEFIFTANPFTNNRQYVYMKSTNVDQDEFQFRTGSLYNNSAVTTISSLTFYFPASNVVADSRIRLYATASS